MSVEAPPPSIVLPLAQWVPGIWPAFIALANEGLVHGGATVITSWWRSPSDNRRVGGSPTSQHLMGLAFDAAGPSGSLLAAALRAVGFVAVEEGSHVHAQAYPAGTLDPALAALGLREV